MTATRYSTTVTKVGPMVAELLGGGRLILFEERAPEELQEICALHRPDGEIQPVQPGDTITIGTDSLTVTAVGDVANANLQALGHITLRVAEASGGDASPLPGEIVVSGTLPTTVEPGTAIRFEGG